jgi:hypothetical protein
MVVLGRFASQMLHNFQLPKLRVNWGKKLTQFLIDFNNLLEQLPQISNRGVILLIPTKLYVDWYHYVSNNRIKHSINSIESISLLIDDFDTLEEFEYWLERHFQLLFEIRLNYSCTDKTRWP